MKKTLFALSLVLSQLAFCQITLTSADMPVLGDTLRVSSALLDQNVLTNYQRSGPNQTWNFDSLRVTSQVVREFVSASSTPYNSVPSSRIGLKFADTLSLGANSVTDVFNFANSTTTDFSVDWRAASIPTGIPLFPVFIMQNSYLDKDEIFQFPLDYQDRDSSTFDFVFNNAFPSIHYRSSGYRINEVDGWGSVSTPYGTFNTLRVVTDMISLDSASFNGQTIAIPVHLREYQWIAKGERISIMKVSGLVTAGIFAPTAVEYRDSARIVEPLLPTIALFIADTTSVAKGEVLDFTNLSIGSTAYQWDFTPNTVTYTSGSSTTSNISVTFQDTGKYSVRLIASGGSSADTLSRIDYIAVTSPVVVIDTSVSFKLESDTAVTNLDFIIYNTSKFGKTFSWEVTPGTYVKDGVSRPTFVFKAGTNRLSSDSVVIRFERDGYYSVRLNATDGSELKFAQKTDAIFAQFPVGINENNLELNTQVSLVPNIIQKGGAVILEVENSIQLQGFEVYDMNGKLISTSNVFNAKFVPIDAPTTSGMYIFKVITNKGVTTKNLLVE